MLYSFNFWSQQKVIDTYIMDDGLILLDYCQKDLCHYKNLKSLIINQRKILFFKK